ENRHLDVAGIVKYLRASCERIGYRDRNRFSSTDYDDDDDDKKILRGEDGIEAIEVLSSDCDSEIVSAIRDEDINEEESFLKKK
ncbi:7098_t:CDS:2, partial [Ambispora gerdemannii]